MPCLRLRLLCVCLLSRMQDVMVWLVGWYLGNPLDIDTHYQMQDRIGMLPCVLCCHLHV
jgi:hypothetical protein